MTKLPLVSIVTVNYNQAQVTCELLETLQHLSYPHVEVIVVDNGSKEGYEIFQEKYPFIVFVRVEINNGFASGNNAGMKVAKGDYILMLNNDTEVLPGFLEPLVARMQSDSKIGLLSPKLLYYYAPGIIQYAGATAINPYTGRGFSLGFKQLDDGRFDTAMQTYRAHGAAMMVSREAFEKVGLMYEEFYLYYEEMDYCEMIKRAGYTIWYEPASAVQHKESVTNKRNSPLKTYYLARNRVWFMQRNFSSFQFFVFCVYMVLFIVPKSTLLHLLKAEFAHLKAFYTGLFQINSPKN